MRFAGVSARRLLTRLCLLAVVCILASAVAHVSSAASSLRIRLVRPDGSPLAHAEVILLSSGRRLALRADDAGLVALPYSPGELAGALLVIPANCAPGIFCVPQVIDLGRSIPDTVVIREAAILELKGLLIDPRDLSAKRPWRVSIYAPLGPYEVAQYGAASSLSADLLGLRPDEVAIPADLPVYIKVEAEGVELWVGDRGKPFVLKPGEHHVVNLFVESVRRLALQLEAESLMLRSEIRRLRSNGLCLGLQVHRLTMVPALTAEALAEASTDPIASLAKLKRAEEIVVGARRAVSKVRHSSSLMPLTFLSLLLAFYALVHALTEDPRMRWLGLIACSVGVPILVFVLERPFLEPDIGTYMFLIYAPILGLLIFGILPGAIPEIRSPGKVSVKEAFVISMRMAFRTFARRRLRYALLIGMIAAVSGAAVLFLSAEVSTRVSSLTFRRLSLPEGWMSVQRWGAPLSADDIALVTSHPGLTNVGYIARKVYEPPLTLVGMNGSWAVRVVVGVDEVSAELLGIKATAGRWIMVPSKAARIGARPGAEVRLAGVPLKVVGLLDERWIREARLPSGESLLPAITIKEEGGQVVELLAPEVLVICDRATAERLGAPIIMLCAEGVRDQALAENLAILGYVVSMTKAGGVVTMFPGASLRLHGKSLLIPLSIVYLGLVLGILGGIWERRRELMVMSALGLNPTHIVLLLLGEGLVLGIIGYGVGLLSVLILLRVMAAGTLTMALDLAVTPARLVSALILALCLPSAAMVAVCRPALVAVLPSRALRWRPESRLRAGVYEEELPLRIAPQDAARFLSFIERKLAELDGDLLRLRVLAFGDDFIRFLYLRGREAGYYECRAECELRLTPSPSGMLGVRLRARFLAGSIRAASLQSREVASFVRRLLLEWSARRERLLIPAAAGLTALYTAARALRPSEILLISEDARRARRLAARVARRLYEEGIQPPKMLCVRLEGLSGLRRLVDEASAVCVGERLDPLSLQVLVEAARRGLPILLVRDPRPPEERARDPFVVAEVFKAAPAGQLITGRSQS